MRSCFSRVKAHIFRNIYKFRKNGRKMKCRIKYLLKVAVGPQLVATKSWCVCTPALLPLLVTQTRDGLVVVLWLAALLQLLNRS